MPDDYPHPPANPAITPGSRPNEQAAAPHNAFRLDRVALADSLGAAEEENEDCGIQGFGETRVEQIAGALVYAENSKALIAPDGVDLHALKLVPDANALVVAIRESPDAAAPKAREREEAGLPGERQIASWTIEPGWLSDPEDRTFLGLCLTLENVCDVANGLMPSLRALLDGEEILMGLASVPLTVLTYNSRARFGCYRSSVADATEFDADQARMLWPLLIETLQTGEATEEWDGDRQRGFLLQEHAERHLARQLVQLREELAAAGKATVAELPDPTGGFESYLA